jgi:hypothetical protein
VYEVISGVYRDKREARPYFVGATATYDPFNVRHQFHRTPVAFTSLCDEELAERIVILTS